MSKGRDFDIYQAETGYVAVTNPVRRRILHALAERELELPELVRITRRSKPTLSNLHVRELLQQKLVEELPHPTDARRKVYRLKGRRIGSSDVPIDQLRSAVKQYVALSPLVHALPLTSVVGVLLAGGAGKDVLRAQGVALGAAVAHVFSATGPRDLLTAVAGFLEREGVARVGKIDLDRLQIEVEAAEQLATGKAALDALAAVLAGVLEGTTRARLGESGGADGRSLGNRRLLLALPRG